KGRRLRPPEIGVRQNVIAVLSAPSLKIFVIFVLGLFHILQYLCSDLRDFSRNLLILTLVNLSTNETLKARQQRNAEIAVLKAAEKPPPVELEFNRGVN